eukprot:10038777-Alexandrium_andersonii.AAC.1
MMGGVTHNYDFPVSYYPELLGVTFETFPTEGILGNAPALELGPSTLGRMLEELARTKKSAYGNGAATAENDPIPDFDRWR